MSSFNYQVLLRWSENDEAYVATVPEFPSANGVQESPHAALDDVMASVGALTSTLEARGISAPAPRPLCTYSGQLRLRMPRMLHERLALQAEIEAVSLNHLLVYLLTDALAERRD